MKLGKAFVKISFMNSKEKYAVVEIGGKQYLVYENELLEVEKIRGKEKDKITFDKILLIKDKKIYLGKPYLRKASIKAEIIKHYKAKKIRVATYKAKSRYRKVKGHRQPKTILKILKIDINNQS